MLALVSQIAIKGGLMMSKKLLVMKIQGVLKACMPTVFPSFMTLQVYGQTISVYRTQIITAFVMLNQTQQLFIV